MQTHKRLIARILSLVLTSSMVLTTLPLNVLASEESSEKKVTPFVTENNENNEEGSTELGMLMSNEPLNATNTATGYNLKDKNVEIGAHAEGECGEKNPHVINGTTTNNTISVTGGKHWITLSNVNIDVSKKEVINNSDESTIQGKAAFAITNAEVHLILTNKNTLKSGYGRAGLEVPEGATLHISGTGTLNADSGYGAAGIGGGFEETGGIINITSGTIESKSFLGEYLGGYGAGIGGGFKGAGGTIGISGGTVTANGGAGGAGIGGGEYGAGGIITISRGEVKAYGIIGGAGIGGGYGGAGGNISITGGNVTANSKDGGAGIGGGLSGAGGSITIKEGTVTAAATLGGAGIGGGSEEAGGNITINGGTITATSLISGAGIGGGSLGAGGEITINGGTVTAIGGLDLGIPGTEGPGIGGCTIAWTEPTNYSDVSDSEVPAFTVDPNGTLIIKNQANVTAVSPASGRAIFVEIFGEVVPTKSDELANILQLNFSEVVKASSKIEVSGNNSNNVSYDPNIAFQSIAFTVLTGNHKITLDDAILGHDDDSTYSEDFTISDSGITKFNNVRVKAGGGVIPPDNPEPDPTTPTTPSTGGSSSNTSNNIGAEGTESGSSVKVTTTRTPDEVKNIIEDKYIIDTIEIKKAEEPVKIKIKVDKKKTKDIFVLQTNPETKKVELVAKSEVDNKGYAEFMSDSKEKMTIVTQLNTGFIDTVETMVKPSVTYYVDETQTFKKGWFKLEDKDWYFADYKNEEIQKNRWVADGEDGNKLAKWYYLGEDGVMFEGKWIANNVDGTKWYYVDQNGLFLRDTVIDGYVINSEGYWSK